VRNAHDNRVDDNQGEIVKALKKIGVKPISLGCVGDGCPDLLCGYKGLNILIEVKNPETYGRLNTKQEKWHKTWPGQRAVVTNPDEALALFGITQ